MSVKQLVSKISSLIWSGSKLFAKVINRRQKLPLVERELYVAEQTGMGMASAFKVRNPEDRFSHNKSNIQHRKQDFTSLLSFVQGFFVLRKQPN